MREIIGLCERDTSIETIEDIGCCSGTFIRDASLVLPRLKQLRGWEMAEDSISILRERYADDPRLTFSQTNDYHDIPTENSIVVTIGTLQYMSEAELKDFLAAISSGRSHPVRLVLAEISEFKTSMRDHSTLRSNETYNNSYKKLLKDYSFDLIKEETF